MKKLLATALLLLCLPSAFACMILFLTNGKEVFVANHEDWIAKDAEITFVPASSDRFGMAYFDFTSEGTAQGGMNTAGLFFDGTATPFAAYPANKNKPGCGCYLWTKILAECATVEQAIAYVEKYKVPELQHVHVFFADSLGHSAIVGVYDGELRIHRRNRNYQLLTNFNPANPAYGGEGPCRRYGAAEVHLEKDSSATVANLQAILSKTHQGSLTVYSNIYNLTKREITIYNKGNFQWSVTINLNKELQQGAHSIVLDELFTKKNSQ